MTENLIEMVLKLSEKVGELGKDKEILKKRMEIISATEPPSVPYVQGSVMRCDVTSSATPKNNALKTNRDALSAGRVLLSRNPPLSADFATSRNERNDVSIVPEISRNGNNAAVTADDSFTTV
jgi:hypothetical protein